MYLLLRTALGPVPPGGNPVAVNKYRIVSIFLCRNRKKAEVQLQTIRKPATARGGDQHYASLALPQGKTGYPMYRAWMGLGAGLHGTKTALHWDSNPNYSK